MPPQPPHSGDSLNDEALARVLQQEYEREFRRSQRRQQQQATAVARPPPVAPHASRPESDEDLARRLQASENARSHRHSSRTSATALSSSSHHSKRSSARHNSGPTMAAITPDAEAARRAEQEWHDEELARHVERQEQERASRTAARQMATTRQREPWTCRRCCGYLVPLAAILAVAGALIYFFGINGGDAPSWFPNPDDFLQGDPFTAVNPDEADKWQASNGLELQIWNACQDQWSGYFRLAVQQWDTGSPDALTLTTLDVDYDYNCEQQRGRLKVCNGDYGNTRWRGINHIWLTNGYIVSSAAKMNEYYLSQSSNDQKQYTMCHEIGHGFGLPHTDENFVNRDLGNCMDYTNRPSNNKQPDGSNYQYLAELYGTVDGSPVPGRNTDVVTETAAEDAVGGGGKNAKKERGGKRGRRGRRTTEATLSPEALAQAADQAEHDTFAADSVRIEHHADGEIIEQDLGNGNVLRSYMLLAIPEEER